MVEKILGQRYKLVERVHGPGVSEWYHALDTFLPRMVTIKMYQIKELGDQIEAWKRAAQIAASLSHPHVVSIFDMGFDKEQIYLVMEHLEGEPLQKVIRERKRFTVEQVIQLSAGLADALVYIHKTGILHGSLSTENVWWNGSTVKIADFCGGIVSHETDLMQLGKLIDEWVVGTVPLSDDPSRQMLDRIVDRAIGRVQPFYKDIQEMANDLHMLCQHNHRESTKVEPVLQEYRNPSRKECNPLGNSIKRFIGEGGALQKSVAQAKQMDQQLKKWGSKRKKLGNLSGGTGKSNKFKTIIVSLLGASTGLVLVVVIMLLVLSNGIFPSKKVKQTQSNTENTGLTNQAQASGASGTDQASGTVAETPDGTAPNVVGLTQQDAQRQLVAAGYRYYYEIHPSDQPSGTVFRQEPAAGTSLPKGSRVQIWISQ